MYALLFRIESFIISKAKELCFETSTNMKYSTALINSRFGDHLRVWFSNGTNELTQYQTGVEWEDTLPSQSF